MFSTTTWYQIKLAYTLYYNLQFLLPSKRNGDHQKIQNQIPSLDGKRLPGHVFNKAWKEAPWSVLSIKSFHTILIKLNERFLCDFESMIENCLLNGICMVSRNTIWLYYSQCPFCFCRRVCRTSTTLEHWQKRSTECEYYSWLRLIKIEWLSRTKVRPTHKKWVRYLTHSSNSYYLRKSPLFSIPIFFTKKVTF